MNHTMKRIDKLAVVLVVLSILARVSSPVFDFVTLRLFAAREFEAMKFEARAMQTVWAVLDFLVNIAVGVWVFDMARRDKRAKWVWALLGLTYGILAPLLYVLLNLCERIERLLIASGPSKTS